MQHAKIHTLLFHAWVEPDTSPASSTAKRCASGCTLARVASTVSSSEAFWRSLGRAHFTPEGGAHRLASLCVCVLHSLHSTVKDTQGKAQHGPIVDRPSTWLLLTLLQLQCIFLCPPFDASHVQLQSRLGNSSL